MFSALFAACLKVGLPVLAASYWLVYRALERGTLTDDGDFDAFKAQVSGMKSAIKQERRKRFRLRLFDHSLQSRWMEFGGGFYGLMALLTYVWIEAQEIWNFVLGGGIYDVLTRLTTLGLWIGFIINTLLNVLWALIWPVTWLNGIGHDPWVWFLVAYGAYLAGVWLARRRFRDPGLQAADEAGQP